MTPKATITDIEKCINRLNFLEMQYIYKDGSIFIELTSDINFETIRVSLSDESILRLANGDDVVYYPYVEPEDNNKIK